MIRNLGKLTTIQVCKDDVSWISDNIPGNNIKMKIGVLIDYWERTHGKSFWEQSVRQLVDTRFRELAEAKDG